MAKTDTIEQTEVTSEAPSESATENASRKRVDLTTLDPNDKVVFSFHVPAGMRLQLRQLAQDAGTTEADHVRGMLAGMIGYTIPDSFVEKRGRTGQYSGLTEDERKAAIKAENDKKRGNVNRLLAAVEAGQISDDVLAALGISKDDLPKPRVKEEATA